MVNEANCATQGLSSGAYYGGQSEGIAKAKESRTAITMTVIQAENGWVVQVGRGFWVAADAKKLAALLEALAEEFQEREVTL